MPPWKGLRLTGPRAAGHLPGGQRAARVRVGRAGGVHGRLRQRSPRRPHAQAQVRTCLYFLITIPCYEIACDVFTSAISGQACT